MVTHPCRFRILGTAFHFTSTSLSDRDVLWFSKCSKESSGQVMEKYFLLNNKRIHQDLEQKGCVDLQKQKEHHIDYGSCALTFVVTVVSEQIRYLTL